MSPVQLDQAENHKWRQCAAATSSTRLELARSLALSMHQIARCKHRGFEPDCDAIAYRCMCRPWPPCRRSAHCWHDVDRHASSSPRITRASAATNVAPVQTQSLTSTFRVSSSPGSMRAACANSNAPSLRHCASCCTTPNVLASVDECHRLRALRRLPRKLDQAATVSASAGPGQA